MSDNLDKLKGHSDKKQDLNRRTGEVKGKEGLRLSKRIDDIRRVISDPDVWNANIASRDRMDDVEQRLIFYLNYSLKLGPLHVSTFCQSYLHKLAQFLFLLFLFLIFLPHPL